MSANRSDQMLRDEGLNVISQSLYKEIYTELPNKIRDRRRWIWELMQNAKDVIRHKGYVELILTEETVTFAHNGAPFLYNNLAAILSQRTSKAPDYTDDQKKIFFDKIFCSEQIVEDEELQRFLKTSGRFGSGFMTTYLLSKKILLESLYTDGERTKKFSLSLDRSVQLETDLINKVKVSFDRFAEIESFGENDIITGHESNPNECHTKFTYTFEDDASKVIAKEGIEDLHASVQCVFCFVDLFEQVIINENGKITVYTRMDPLVTGEVSITRVLKTTNGNDPVVLQMVKVSTKYNVASIALPVVPAEGTYSLAAPHPKTPFQFISFPLIGSESFSFPVIVNSPLFNPGDLRDKVHLNLTTECAYNKKVSLNRELLEKCLELYRVLVTYAIGQKWQNLHFLAKTAIPPDTDSIWYKDNIQSKILTTIRDSSIVKPYSGEVNICVKDAKFPVYDNGKLLDLWNLCAYLIPDKIPDEIDAPLWKKIITDNKDCWEGADLDFGLEKLLGLIMDCVDMKTFTEKYFEGNAAEAYKALNEIIRFTEEENKELLDRIEDPFLIIPSQTGLFTEKKKLRRDKGWPEHPIPHQIKTVLKTMGNNWFEKLVSDDILCFESVMTRSVKEASDRVKAKAEKYLLKPIIKESEVEELKNLEQFYAAMFELIGFCSGLSEHHQDIFDLCRKLFPDLVSGELIVIDGAKDFDWSYCYRWMAEICTEKIASFKNMEGLCHFLNGKVYPAATGLTDEEINIKYSTDTFISGVISFAGQFNNNADRLLEKHSIVPNQNNDFQIFSIELFNDTYKKSTVIGQPDSPKPIPERLKELVKELGHDVRKSLLHEGVSLKLPAALDTEYLCGVADKLIIDSRDSTDPLIKNAIRELDKWIALNIDESNRGAYFGRFYEKRHSIVLNTYTPEERNNVDQILKSGQSAALAKISKNVSSAETINKIAELVESNDIGEVMSVMEKYPGITTQRMEYLLRLEELSKGLKTDVEYTPDEIQQSENFLTGYKGEAFIYQQLKGLGINIEWTNLSNVKTDTLITDDTGAQHYILDKGKQYDLVADLENGHKVYIQVKATKTDIKAADLIALPISTKEWTFLGDTKLGESFYLVRVFNIGNGPKPYYLKMGDQLLN
jgi:hypothetical protein